jgi:hypothetical protein
MVENLCLAGESYIYANIDEFDDISIIGNQIEITIEELIIYGSVERDLLNPKTENKINNDTLIYTVLNDKSLKCQYQES